MQTLKPDECRVLGVMIEKAQTTPGQYPLSLNGLTVGCNQKNNRDPITELSEEQVYDALDSLRRRGLVRETMLSGSRVSKFKHEVREKLAVSVEEMVLLAELWLRGPQSAGELRSRAARMHALGPIEDVQRILRGMMENRESMGPFGGGAMVKEIAPAPGERAVRYAQLLCPTLHPVSLSPPAASFSSAGSSSSSSSSSASAGAAYAGSSSAMRPGHAPASELEERVARLEGEVAALRAEIARLAAGTNHGA